MNAEIRGQTPNSNSGSDPDSLTTEGVRQIQICNSCRYCQGYCAVFPAIEKRLEFDRASLDYLANLCHHCGACYYACQYAPPHEFAINIPKLLTQVRLRSYEDYAWPRAFASAYRHGGAVAAWALAGGLAAFLLLAAALNGGLTRTSGSFYSVFPHGLLITIFGLAFLFAIVAMTVGAIRFTRALPPASGEGRGRGSLDALTLANLEGGGEGCYVRAGFDHPSEKLRRWFHHFTFYGFLLCFASTSLATIYHYALAAPAPYPLMHPVVLLGTLGGVGLLIGPAGLLLLKRQHDPVLLDEAQRGFDAAFTWLLLLASATGLVLLAARDTAAMPALLAIHLGVVLALFLTLPYGKSVHGLYRYLALAR